MLSSQGDQPCPAPSRSSVGLTHTLSPFPAPALGRVLRDTSRTTRSQTALQHRPIASGAGSPLPSASTC